MRVFHSISTSGPFIFSLGRVSSPGIAASDQGVIVHWTVRWRTGPMRAGKPHLMRPIFGRRAELSR